LNSNRPGPLARLWRKFLLAPNGYGRPIDAATADREYDTGAWAHFHSAPERSRQEAVLDCLATIHPNPAILDLGCGSGRLAELLQPRTFRRYVGVDFSPAGLEIARALKLGQCEFIEGDFTTWRPRERFDAIVFSECVGYAHDPGAFVASFLPWLAPGGAMVISYYRSGHWRALWRRIERQVQTITAFTVANELGQVWDIKVMRPRHPV
jgi:SAM-dependent methyltransferase